MPTPSSSTGRSGFKPFVHGNGEDPVNGNLLVFGMLYLPVGFVSAKIISTICRAVAWLALMRDETASESPGSANAG
jgi:hypothetical protein